eukprot:Nk52_evm16s355 gene=Nk52_evmTU16s355
MCDFNSGGLLEQSQQEDVLDHVICGDFSAELMRLSVDPVVSSSNQSSSSANTNTTTNINNSDLNQSSRNTNCSCDCGQEDPQPPAPLDKNSHHIKNSDNNPEEEFIGRRSKKIRLNSNAPPFSSLFTSSSSSSSSISSSFTSDLSFSFTPCSLSFSSSVARVNGNGPRYLTSLAQLKDAFSDYHEVNNDNACSPQKTSACVENNKSAKGDGIEDDNGDCFFLFVPQCSPVGSPQRSSPWSHRQKRPFDDGDDFDMHRSSSPLAGLDVDESTETVDEEYDGLSGDALRPRRRNSFLYHKELSQALDAELNLINAEKIKKWNFDFANEKPLDGNYSWQRADISA